MGSYLCCYGRILGHLLWCKVILKLTRQRPPAGIHNTSCAPMKLVPQPLVCGFLFPAALLLLASNAARATSVVAPDFDSLVRNADYVVRATVKSVTSEYRTTPQGKA